MNFKVTTAKLSANPDSLGWSQTYTFKPLEEEKLHSKGQVFAVMSTASSKGGVENTFAGREILARLHEEYFGGEERNVLTLLKSSVAKVIDEFSNNSEIVEIASASIIDNVVYLAAGGGASIAIFREGELIRIIKSTPNLTFSASGYAKDKDIYILATKKFYDSFKDNEIISILNSGDPQILVENFAPHVHALEEAGDLGVLLLKLESEMRATKEDKDSMLLENLTTKATATVHTDKEGSASDNKIQKLLNNISTILPHKISERKIFIKTYDPSSLSQRKKVSLSVGIITLILLIVSIGFGIRQKRMSDYKSSYTTLLEEATHKLDESQSIYSVSPERARELFLDARDKIRSLNEKNIKDPKLDELTSELARIQGRILGEYDTKPDPYVDLSLLSSGFKAKNMVASDDAVYILDNEGKRIASVKIDSKRSEIVAGPAILSEANDITSYKDEIFIKKKDGIYRVEQKLVKVIDSDWEGEVLIYSYGGNFYILDKQASTIWRYVGIDEGFTPKKSWFTEDVERDLSNSMSWTIDGSVWVLTKSGKVQKFSSGLPENFELSGVFPAISDPIAIYTNEESEYIYILESAKSRIVVVSKEGEFKAQYIADEINLAKGLAAFEKEKKLILLFEDRLASVEIKHLD